MDAIDDLSDAIETTRSFFTPIRPGMLIKLAIVVFFVSSLGFGGATFPTGDVATFADDPTFEDGFSEAFGDEFAQEFEEEFGEELPLEEIVLALLVIGLVLLFLWLLYAVIAAVMEFVFIESLRTTEVHVRRYFAANVGNGLRLFLFRLGLVVVAGVLATAPAAYVVLGDGAIADLSAGAVGIYVLYGLGLGLVYSIVNRFTDEFVAPIMLLEDRGVLSAWGRFWTTLRANWAEYAVYLVLVWILFIAIAIAAWFVVTLGTLALLIPFAIVIFALLLAGDVGIVLAVFVALLALAVILLFVSLVWTPVVTYFQYYALLVLGDTNDDLDLIPDQRAAARAGDERPARGGRRAGDEYDERGRPDRTRDDDRRDDSSSWDDDSSGWDDDSSGWDGNADDENDWDDDTGGWDGNADDEGDSSDEDDDRGW